MRAQCTIDPSDVYTFGFEGKTYEIIRDNRTWEDAAACAVARGGYLAEVNSAAEQDTLYARIMQAGITPSSTVAPDGGGASYLWLGGNDLDTEGEWVWDGDNTGSSSQFWQGNASGNPVNGSYTNWGNEPDNYNEQDALGIAITDWPLGVASQWNDVDAQNSLYFVVEHPVQDTTPPDPPLGVANGNADRSALPVVYPNPVKNTCNVRFPDAASGSISLRDVHGRVVHVQTFEARQHVAIPVFHLPAGCYTLVHTSGERGSVEFRKILVTR